MKITSLSLDFFSQFFLAGKGRGCYEGLTGSLWGCYGDRGCCGNVMRAAVGMLRGSLWGYYGGRGEDAMEVAVGVAVEMLWGPYGVAVWWLRLI